MNKISQQIELNTVQSKKMIAILLDPEKCIGEHFNQIYVQLQQHQPDFIFIGGSTGNFSAEGLVAQLAAISSPKILFPGDASQFAANADGLLFLSLLSGRNSDYLIGQHVKSAKAVKESGVEVIPTAYILIDGGRKSAVERVSKTMPISSDDSDEVVTTAIAGELLGMKLVYLEAGSGAASVVPTHLISMVKAALDIPLIVGGGISNYEQITRAFEAGADIVVIGNALEKKPELLAEFISAVQSYNKDKA